MKEPAEENQKNDRKPYCPIIAQKKNAPDDGNGNPSAIAYSYFFN
jgi:hypothetical protein